MNFHVGPTGSEGRVEGTAWASNAVRGLHIFVSLNLTKHLKVPYKKIKLSKNQNLSGKAVKKRLLLYGFLLTKS